MLSLMEIFREVRDPRDPNAQHDLGALLFLALAATLCGAKSCVQIAEFAEARADTLREIIDLPHGVPSHDTFSRVFRLLDPKELERAFAACMARVRQELGHATPAGVVAVDGKSLRRGYDTGRAHLPPLMVSVWDTQTRLTLAQARAPGGNEVAATLELLRGLVLKGCTVTADALHCHPRMAEAVLGAKAHYALELKGNHGPLHAAAEQAFAQAGTVVASYTCEERGHGRSEWRQASVIPATSLARPAALPGLKAVGRVVCRRTGASGTTGEEVHYVALSRRLTPAKMLEIKRAHWSIENHLHWTLDVLFHEDDARTRKDHAPENLAVIRRLAQNILRAHPLDRSMSLKMFRAMISQEFFFELFAYMR
ncbi:ISAs1 family transposase [Roseomonas genomospecies 6]|uniref:ISAs1 family transposase n=2 Tax=Roseomonas genomospecies 6 TaxID=214106 RepID=A0A9W7KNF2_9PROT|nr:ISAs1 family transposase [Roseomonas genomospecies 6]KAA0675618.1 ISAs1 family transposase [Roseomonas genomospecies 6]